jgi:hypothetical protein
MSIRECVKQADRAYRRFDIDRDRQEVIAEVKRLTDAGLSASTIGDLVGLTSRSVVRIRAELRGGAVYEPIKVDIPDVDDKKVRRLEQTVDVAIELACRLRDEHPQIVWDALNKMDQDQLLELSMVVLAGLPIYEKSKYQLFDWVLDLPAAKYEVVK